ncbi:MAG: hypothetical protein L0H64_05640 [Pseudonocardia sp.]|nr:hypothetical protein [Pseudonocardia sp.]
MIANLAGSVLLGGAAVLVGVWGRRYAASLLPPTLPAEDRRRRAVVYRRGALACQVAGVLLISVGVLSTLT